MSKVILIGVNNKYSASANKYLLSLAGLLFLTNGMFIIYANNLEPFGIILGVLTLIGGLWYIFYGIFGFSENSKFAPKVKVDKSMIELKNSLWKPSTTLKWTDLSWIKFQPYAIIFELQGSSHSFSYNSNSDVSRTIKQTIRKFAEERSIEVTGG